MVVVVVVVVVCVYAAASHQPDRSPTGEVLGM